MRRIVIFLLITLPITAGCSAVGYQVEKEGTKVSGKQLKEIEKGVTTKKEIIALLGYPDQTSSDKEGEIYVYKYTRKRGAKFNLLFGLGSARAKATTLTIFLDENGIVKDYIFKKPGRKAKVPD